ncbi:MAG: SDR family oxidoreductase [Kiritimatiellae bacterium]|nr:SDR family oxidoreductase [Kiritimatiellia bacterium]
MELKDKVAIITGAGRGIGRSLSLMLAAEGCRVAGVARSRPELDALAAEIGGSGGEALVIDADLADLENARSLVDRVLARFGRLDILVNNAGVILPKPFLEVTEQEYDYTLELNLKSMFILCQKALAVMKEQRSGYIVNVSSTVALGVPAQHATYGASKCGVVGLSQALYETAKPFGVKVSIVYPGITDTKMVRDLHPPTQPEQWMQPEDIADCIRFLLKQSERVVIRELVPWSTGYDKI